jgi:hypothetical protein
MSVPEQPVAHPPDVEHEGAVTARGKPAPQARGVRVERPRLPERLESPHLAQELLLREDARGVRRELEQQLVLLRRQVDAGAVDGDPPRRPVDLDLADLEAVDDERLGSPQDRPDPSQQGLVSQ